MYSVTAGFLTEIAANPGKVYGKVQIDYTDPFLDQSIAVTATEETDVSFPGQTANGITSMGAAFAALDDLWTIDDDYTLAPEDGSLETGWWGTQLAGSGGSFVATYPKLTATFASRPVWSLRVVGDDKRSEYPVDFTVKLYSTGDTLEHTETVTGNTDVTWTTDITPHTEIVKSVLEITKWSTVGCQAKIAEFFTSIQETYEGDEIIGIKLLEEREITRGGLPVGNISSNEVEIRLSNITRYFDADNTSSPLYELIKSNRRIKAWLGVMVSGSVEYVPLGTFWSGDWEVPEDEIYARTTARDRLELLRKTNYSNTSVQESITLYDLAADVLTDAGLAAAEYSIDIELDDYTIPYAYFNNVSHREALRLIAEAVAGQVYADRDGVIRIDGPSYLSGVTSSSLTVSKFFKKNTPAKTDELANYIEVETQPLSEGTLTEIYRSNSTIAVAASSSVSLSVTYNTSPCVDVVGDLEGETNTTISAATYGATGADVTLTNSGGSTENVTLTIDGKPLTAANRVKVISQDSDSITEYGKIKFVFPQNSLIQAETMAQDIADLILAAYKDARRDLDMEWRGNPAVELSDKITVESVGYHVIRQEFNYDGALRTKTIGRRA